MELNGQANDRIPTIIQRQLPSGSFNRLRPGASCVFSLPVPYNETEPLASLVRSVNHRGPPQFTARTSGRDERMF